MGDREELRYLPSELRQTVASRLSHFMGTPPSCCRRRNTRPCRVGCLSLSEGRRAEVSDALDALWGDHEPREPARYRGPTRYPSQLGRCYSGLSGTGTACPA